MEYAIDRYGIGTEIEVSADEFDNSYIPRRTSRFFCPECGEAVYWRAAGGAHCSHFYHKVKTAHSPECDKRVDGRSGLNLYERVGLPIYLINSGTSFQLSIGFPALGSRLLGVASQRNAKVYIKTGVYERSVFVSQSTFFENTTTLIPVNFIPSYTANYSIYLRASSSIYELQHRWSDYADGFDYGGAIFSYDDVNSKKVRRGDCISPGKQYYIVSSNFSPTYPEIKCKRVGSIQLNTSTYGVYLVEIDVSSKNETRFTTISNYFKRLFNVWLLETAPEIIPLALLVRRVLHKLGIDRTRVQFILTSASVPPEDDKVYRFACDLSAQDVEKNTFRLIKGTDEEIFYCRNEFDPAVLMDYDIDRLQLGWQEKSVAIQEFGNLVGFHTECDFADERQVEIWLYDCLQKCDPMLRIMRQTRGHATSFKELAEITFPNASKDIAEKATSTLLAIAPLAKSGNGNVLYPARLHMMFRGLQGLFASVKSPLMWSFRLVTA